MGGLRQGVAMRACNVSTEKIGGRGLVGVAMHACNVSTEEVGGRGLIAL